MATQQLFLLTYMMLSQASLSNYCLLAVANSCLGFLVDHSLNTLRNGWTLLIINHMILIDHMIITNQMVLINQIDHISQEVLIPTNSLTSTTKGLLLLNQKQNLSTMLGEGNWAQYALSHKKKEKVFNSLSMWLGSVPFNTLQSHLHLEYGNFSL